MVDGKEVGRVKQGEQLVVELAPGRHEVFAKIDWARSPTVEVDLAERDRVVLECAPQTRPLFGAYLAFFHPREYLNLRRVATEQ
jgi:hypothetical protein